MFTRGKHEKSTLRKLSDSGFWAGLGMAMFITMPVWMILMGII